MTFQNIQKRFNMVVNGWSASSLDLEGWRCVGTDWDGKCDNESVCGDESAPDYDPSLCEVETTERLWSDPNSWPGAFGDEVRIPRDGDDVKIDPTWNMIYDLPVSEAPKLNFLEINGALTFRDGEDRLMKSYGIWVRRGTLNIGSAAEPF
jgi:hypothetical protein